ncbi:hypothetical protein [Nocardioides jiangxiensis]|uniref:Uncharacterized protein n=1 Tax=Nocardioides jiangxiensis TaxID=3064524 RepID=A0ABT9AZD2_9ACTN|nr:hypothetical protein [Nocardioides sp. WY-20]MDO7867957.1 hypothetical protein [Nocardioides sp. WY-20]
MDEENDSPVVNGLVALIAVALVIGLLAAIIAMLGTRLVGLTGDSGASSDGVAAGDSLSLPPLEPTELDSGLLITLAPTQTATTSSSAPLGIGESATPSAAASDSASATPDSKRGILLQASDSTVTTGDDLMLSGTYKGGEGAVLGIWYDYGQGWQAFNLSTNVYGGVFQAFVSTYKTGTVQWQVRDPETDTRSNIVTVHYED